MANVKSRPDSRKNASTKSSKQKKSTGIESPNESNVMKRKLNKLKDACGDASTNRKKRNEDTQSAVDSVEENMQSTCDENIKDILKNGHRSKGKNIFKKQQRMFSDYGLLKARRRNKMKLFDILKNELMIDVEPKKKTRTANNNGVAKNGNNNNDSAMSDNNKCEVEVEREVQDLAIKESKKTASSKLSKNSNKKNKNKIPPNKNNVTNKDNFQAIENKGFKYVGNKCDIVAKNVYRREYKNENRKRKKHNINKDNVSENLSPANGIVLEIASYQCDYCQRIFTNKSSLRRHIYMHLDVKPHTCSFCLRKFRQLFNLRLHIRNIHSEIDKEDQFFCSKCEKPFTLMETLPQHLSSNSKKALSYCLHCNKRYSHNLLLIKHEREHVKNGNTGQYQCNICKMNYDCRSRLSMHLKGHLQIKEFICQYCGKEFLRPNSVKRHVEICHGDYKVQCPVCKKYLKGHLTEHMRLHEKKRPHECPDCGQRFTQSTQLTVHRRSHTGARPYPCRICERPFTHSNALMLHIRRHTGEKPFVCAMCPIAFSQLPHMKAHMLKIHGKSKPYKCKKCEQFFKLKKDVENHEKTCTVGVKVLSFEEQLEASVKVEEMEMVHSAMNISRMRYLLALLLTMIATKEKLKYLGFNKCLIDDLLIESLEAMGHTPCKDASQPPIKRLKTNIDILLKGTIPQEEMAKFHKENKTTEEILELLTTEKRKK